MEMLRRVAEAAGLPTNNDLVTIIAGIIATFLSLLGIIFLILVIYGGFLWMTSMGNEQKVLKAKKTLSNAVVGLIIIVSSYSIANFVLNALEGAMR